MRYAFINTWSTQYPLQVLCRVLGVSRSGYHAWCVRPPSPRAQENARLSVALQAAHQRTRGTYGPERLQAELGADGFKAGVGRIRRLRKILGLRCKQVRPFRATTNSKHDLPVAPNLLQQRFTVDRPNAAWVTDLTYVPTAEGFLYLAALKDLYSGAIVGYALGARMTEALVTEALMQAVQVHKPRPGLIHHSDRGSQYCARTYQKLLKHHGLIPSMSRRGNCYDNAPIESFWGTLKTERVHHQRYLTRAEAITDITEYIEIFYNRQRRQARLGYVSPAVFVQQYRQKQAA